MITVSTSKSASRAYHHGDLRAALIEQGITLVESDGVEALSLREIARRAGVSATAVYRHFPDKKALLAALSAEAVRRLGEAQRTASQMAGGGSAGFGETGRAYVRFALANPGLFRLAFAHADTAHEGLHEGDNAADLLLGYARQFSGGDPARAEALVLQAWSVAHGLAMLMLDGRIKPSDATIDAVIDAATLFVRQGTSSDASP